MEFQEVEAHDRFAEYMEMLERRALEHREETISKLEADKAYLLEGRGLRQTPGNIRYQEYGASNKEQAIAYIDDKLCYLRQHLPIEITDATRASFLLWLERGQRER